MEKSAQLRHKENAIIIIINIRNSRYQPNIISYDQVKGNISLHIK